ncbi:MAG: hypothetical protein CM15mP25_2610 [Gammaproteobacteria bacterium]|nr:MAG: hypothetical protein CM15mP25_2610 [Gammaproteobacteria bacterium]
MSSTSSRAVRTCWRRYSIAGAQFLMRREICHWPCSIWCPRRVPGLPTLAPVSAVLAALWVDEAERAMTHPDILIVGAGVAGLSPGDGARREGFRVTVIDGAKRRRHPPPTEIPMMGPACQRTDPGVDRFSGKAGRLVSHTGRPHRLLYRHEGVGRPRQRPHRLRCQRGQCPPTLDTLLRTG